ncbi:MAG: RNA polymerase sigma factor RpoD [uncultured bacterium (gcode 4)]|uniref:RNA polymerase sigma factor RpoD n=1 Tax=uncultured bacterium (gcode 4) TaxID=1234023 RepID=K2AXR7_9BACT|nr:MAG: RNA polymerase sigma factor RpoD [uncultured bacterium (gcode 4)]
MLEVLAQIDNQHKSTTSLDENIKEDSVLELLKEITKKDVIKLVDIKPTRALKNAILSEISEIKKLEDLIFVCLREIRKTKPLKLEEEKELWRKIKKWDKEARQKFIEANLYLVIKIAKNKRYEWKWLELLDLVQEWTLGLLEAVNSNNPERKNKFSTYAIKGIKRFISRAIYEKWRTISLTYYILKKVNRIKRISINLSKKLWREPTINELAGELKMSIQEIEKFIIFGRDILSLDFPINEAEDTVLLDFMEDTNNICLEESINTAIISEKVDRILKNLKPRDEQIMRMRFWFDWLDEMTLVEVWDKFGVKKQWIYEAEKRIFKKLRKNPEFLKIAEDLIEK